jgi:hypothetical protein
MSAWEQAVRALVEAKETGDHTAIESALAEYRAVVQSERQNGSSDGLAERDTDSDVATESTVASPGESAGRQSQSTMLVDLAAECELWHTPGADPSPYARVPVGTHRETMPVQSRRFRRWLSQQSYEQLGKAPGGQALQDAINVIAARATFDAPEMPVYVRIARHGDAIYVDLGNPEWEAVEITAYGWRVVADPPARFRRSRGTLALPYPVHGGSVNELRQFVNVTTEDDWRLFVGWLLMAFHPDGPYPVLNESGEQGSGKTLTARCARSLIDPNAAPVRAEPRDPRDLMIAAENSWVVALDNLSHVAPWLSDGLCRLATGGGFSTRELYSDGEETIFTSKRPVILTGIEELATRSDLIDRSLIINHLPIDPQDRRPESELLAQFEEARPRILGALLDAAVTALRELPNTRLPRLPRMADFALWVTAAEPALGWPRGAFLHAYDRNPQAANDLALEGSLIVPPLRVVAGERTEPTAWRGTATELLDELAQRVDEKSRQRREWPGSARALSGQLKRLAPNLRAAGIGIEYRRLPGGDRKREWAIWNNPADLRPDRPQRPDEHGSRDADAIERDANEVARDAHEPANRAERDGRDANTPGCSNAAIEVLEV